MGLFSIRVSRVALAVFSSALAVAGTLDDARISYQHANYAAVVSALNGAHDFPSLLLQGQSYVMLADYKQAIAVLDEAVGLQPGSSDAHLWLGRAYGRRAEKAFATAAMGYAGKARENFEKAVELNPKNWDALDDLFQYYLEAPGFLGGGLDKAAKLIEQIGQHDPAEAAADRGRIAERKKDYPAAEAEYRKAVELAPNQPRRVAELARFQAKRKAAGN